MIFNTTQKSILFITLVLLYLSAWSIQADLLIKGDVIWLFSLADKVLNGGKYLHDFFEINPPLSIYIYIPAVFISKIFFLSPIHSARSYIFGLSICSLLLCYLQINTLFSKQEAKGALSLLITIAFVFIILPMSEFGQRENLLVILTLPYFLSLTSRLKNQSVSTVNAILIGFMAGIGFAIKPFYLIPLLLTESYYLFTRKKIRCLIRPETITIALVIITYLFTVFYFNPDYVLNVIPVATAFYYTSFASPITHVIHTPIFFYLCFALGLYAIQYKQLGNDFALASILLLAMSGFTIGYLLQRIPWYYHIYPAFAFAILYFAVMFYVLTKQLQPHTSNISTLFCFAIIMWNIFIFYYSSNDFIWYIHFFTILGLLLYSYHAWLKQLHTFKISFLLSLLLIFFTFPLHFLLQYFEINNKQKKDLNGLIQLLHTHKNNQPIYFFSSMSAYMVSVFEHANVKHASRLQFLAWMRYFYNCTYDHQMKTKANWQATNQFFIHLLVSDINKNKPAWILVDTQNYYGIEGGMSIDYLAYLKQQPAFQSAWSHYHYIGMISNAAFPYRFTIYSRD